MIYGVPYFGVYGSSLPNCSGVPVARNLSWRAFDRATASAIIFGVAVVGGTFTLTVDVVGVVVVVEVVASWADDTLATA
jgi:hypothetical protein